MDPEISLHYKEYEVVASTPNSESQPASSLSTTVKPPKSNLLESWILKPPCKTPKKSTSPPPTSSSQESEEPPSTPSKPQTKSLPSLSPSPSIIKSPGAYSKAKKCGDKTSARDRHAYYAKSTIVQGDLLFCAFCNIVIDHTRKSSVEQHQKTKLHLRKEKEFHLTEKPKYQQVVDVSVPYVEQPSVSTPCGDSPQPQLQHAATVSASKVQTTARRGIPSFKKMKLKLTKSSMFQFYQLLISNSSLHQKPL